MELSLSEKIFSNDKQAQADFVQSTIKSWYDREDHVRCPFPLYIRKELEKKALLSFQQWTQALDPSKKNEMPLQEFVEIFESILFHDATQLVSSEDEQLTILFPFMPRLGDSVKDSTHGFGTIITRKLEQKEGQKNKLTVSIASYKDQQTWQTSFELPA